MSATRDGIFGFWVSGSELEHLVWRLNNANKVGDPRGMLPLEILKLRYSVIAGNVYYSIHFCFSKFSRMQPSFTKSSTFPGSYVVY